MKLSGKCVVLLLVVLLLSGCSAKEEGSAINDAAEPAVQEKETVTAAVSETKPQQVVQAAEERPSEPEPVPVKEEELPPLDIPDLSMPLSAYNLSEDFADLMAGIPEFDASMKITNFPESGFYSDDYAVVQEHYSGNVLLTETVISYAETDPENHGFTAIPQKAGRKIYIGGFSDRKYSVNGVDMYLVNVQYDNLPMELKQIWTYAPLVNIDQNAEVSDMTVVKVKGSSITIKFTRHAAGAEDCTAETWCYKDEELGCYVFFWASHEEEFYYTDPIGTFLYFPEHKQLVHASTWGHTMECMFYLTEDYRHLIEVAGRYWYTIRDRLTGETIATICSTEGLCWSGDECNATVIVNWWTIKDNKVDEESLGYAETCLEEQGYTLESLNTDPIQVFVNYRMNLLTGERTYKNCRISGSE